MSVLSKSAFEDHADRLAKQLEILREAIAAASASGTSHYNICAAEAENNYSMINALSDNYTAFDTAIASETTLLRSVFSYLINADANHATTEGAASLDAWLTASGIDVHEYYADAYYMVKGSRMQAVNVFKAVPVHLASFHGTDSGVGVFTAGTALGTGSGSQSATNFAGAQLEAYVASGLGASDLQFKLCVVAEGGTSSFVNVTVPSGSSAGTVVDIGSSSDAYVSIDTTQSSVAGGTAGGDNANSIIFRSKLKRTIAL